MALKALNDLIEPDGFIFTLLVFGAYFCMVELNALLLIIA